MKYSPKTHSLINEIGHFCGVQLEPLFAAEQQWGIEPINQAFGITPKKTVPVYQRHRISRLPAEFRFAESATDALLMFRPWVGSNFKKSKRSLPVCEDSNFPNGLVIHPNHRLSGAWRNDAFGLYAAGASVTDLQALRDAFQRKDVAIYYGDHPRHRLNGSLCIMINSATPRAFWPGELQEVLIPHWW